MREIKIVDNYMDKREFRNYINTMLYKHNYEQIKIDDVRISDSNKENDNDIMVKKDNVKYTVQTYLNTKIGEKQINETLKDMEKETVLNGIIVTNYIVPRFIKNKARKQHITILDRHEFEEGIYN